MKICLISNLYEPYARGGAEVIVKRTAVALRKAGHQVCIITARPFAGFSSMTPEKTMEEGITMYRYYPPNLYFYAHDYRHRWPIRLLWHALDIINWPSARSVGCILRDERPDVVITHNLMGLGFLIPRQIARQRIRHIHVLHDIQLAVRSGVMLQGQESGWMRKSLPAKLYQAAVKQLFRSPMVVVSPSQFLLDFYRKLGFFPQSRLQVLRNPVDDRFLQVQHQPAEGIRFLYLGQFAEHKGVRELAQAFMSLDKPSARLTFIGDGPLKNELETIQQQDARIEIRPRLANEQLPDVLAKTDVVVLPTKTYENSPTVVYEALAAGVPVLVTDIGGAAELVTHKQDGFVVTPGDSESLKAGLGYFLALSAEHRYQMGEKGRKKIAPLSSEAYINQLLALISER